MNKILVSLLMASAAILSACGGSDDEPAQVAATDATLGVNLAVAQAAANTPFNFPSGVPDLGTTGTTTVAFTSTATTPAFSIQNGNQTATGTTNFGSCVFVVASSSFPAGHRLAAGSQVTINPCNIRLGTQGAPADSVARQRAAVFILGSAASTGSTVTVAINSGGTVTINGQAAGTVTLVPVSGGGS
jgi:hypothetical protein